jgi:hypothetical protein
VRLMLWFLHTNKAGDDACLMPNLQDFVKLHLRDTFAVD